MNLSKKMLIAIINLTLILQLMLTVQSETTGAASLSGEKQTTGKGNLGSTGKDNTGHTEKVNTGHTEKDNSGSTGKDNTGHTEKDNSGHTEKDNLGHTEKDNLKSGTDSDNKKPDLKEPASETNKNDGSGSGGMEGAAGVPDGGADDRQNEKILEHHDARPPKKGDADGLYPINDHAISFFRKETDLGLGILGKFFIQATEKAKFLRTIVDKKACGTSIASCESYAPMWPQIDGLCDLFSVKCLIEVVGIICRTYKIETMYQYVNDLCEDVSDFCYLNREAVVNFCASHLFQKFADVLVNPADEENSWFGAVRDAIL